MIVKNDCSIYLIYYWIVLFFLKLKAAEAEKAEWELSKSQLQETLEENKEKIKKLETYWLEAQSLCKTVNEHLKETQEQYDVLEKKYNKAKKLLKEYQQKWVQYDFLSVKLIRVCACHLFYGLY